MNQQTNTELDAVTAIARNVDPDTLISLQKFMALLNKDPKQEELVPTADRKAWSMPISRVEMKLDTLFFGLWWTENFTTKQIYNEFVGELELVVIHPVTGTQIRRVGAAAIQITQDSGASVAQFMETKKKNALDLAYPKLKAECVKNAAQSLGKCFGRDINRKIETVDAYSPLMKGDVPIKLPEKAKAALIDKVRQNPTEGTLMDLSDSLVSLNVDEKQADEILKAAQDVVNQKLIEQTTNEGGEQ